MRLKMAAHERGRAIKKPTLSAKLRHQNLKTHREISFRGLKCAGKGRQCGGWHCQQPLQGHREHPDVSL